MARPIATRWRWPPERLAGLRSRCSVSSSVVGGLVDPLAGSPSSDVLLQPQREGDVLEHRQVRVQRVVLEHHRQVAVAGRLVVDPLAADEHVAGGDVLEADDHPQQRRLPAARRADQDHELAVGDVEADVVDGREAVAVAA